MIRFIKWAFAAICLTVLLGPMVQLAIESRSIERDVWKHLSSHLLFPSILNTLIFSLGSALIAIVVGTSWLLLSLFAKRTFYFTISMSLLLAVPTYVMGFLFLSFVDYSGPLQSFLTRAFGDAAIFEPRTLPVSILIYGIVASPYIYFSVLAGVRTQIRTLVEASVSLGGGLKTALLRVVIPTIFPWSVGGGVLVSLEASADFGFVDFFGVNTLSRLLYKSWGSLFSFGGASVISLFLLVICIILLVGSRIFKRPAVNSFASEFPTLKSLFPQPATFKFLVYTLTFIGILLFNVLPIGILLYHSNSISLWAELPLFESLQSTFLIGVLSSLTVGIGMIGLFFLWKGHSWINIFLLGYGLPGTLLAVGYYLFASNILGDALISSGSVILMTLLVLLYFSKFGGLMLRGLSNQYRRTDKSILEAAETLGASFRNFLRVELPLYRPALSLGFTLLFLETIKELPAALMIKPLNQPSLALRVYQYAAESDWERASVYSLVLIALVLFVSLILRVLGSVNVRSN